MPLRLRQRSLFTLLLAAWLPGPPQQKGTDRETAAILRAVESRYEAARTLQATFLERYSTGPGDARVESGTVYFSRPGRMRWEYEAPEKKLFLADGKQVWFYVPADRTATRAKTKESGDWHTPLALLAGKTRRGTFSRLCASVEPAGQASGVAAAAPDNTLLRCAPKGKGAAFSEAYFEIDPVYRLARVLIRERGGIEMEFRFAGWRENPPLAEALFHFQAPPGVAIVEESSLAPGKQ